MDFAGPFAKSKDGLDMVLIAVDKFSRRVHYIPTHRNVSAEDTARLFMRDVVRLHGLPQVIISDRDSKFTSDFWRALFKRLGVKIALSTANHPQTDGQSESAVKTLKVMLRSYVNYKQDNWCDLLPALELAYNRSTNPSTGYSRFELDCGWQPRVPQDVLATEDLTGLQDVDEFVSRLRATAETAQQRILQAQERQAHYYNEHRRHQLFEVGDQVMLSKKHIHPPWESGRPTPKLTSPWLGPYKVLRVLNENSYVLDLPDGGDRIHSTINGQYLKQYVSSPPEFSARVPQCPDPIEVRRGVEMRAPQAILDHRKRGRGQQFLVHWEGLREDEGMWRPEKEFQERYPGMLREYKALQNIED